MAAARRQGRPRGPCDVNEDPQPGGRFTGRADRTKGLLVKRVRDPEVCTAHSRDRARLRQEFGLPVDRVIVGLFGVITANKNAPLVLDALAAASIDADLLLGGRVAPDVSAWLESLPDDRRNRIRIIGGFLDNATLDKLVACVDVAPIVLVNPGPSGIMGKALAAGVPIVTAGSELRAREARATGGGKSRNFPSTASATRCAEPSTIAR